MFNFSFKGVGESGTAVGIRVEQQLASGGGGMEQQLGSGGGLIEQQLES